MGLELEYYPGQTPLDEEEIEALLQSGISNRGELDEFEQLNIEQAVEWSLKSHLKKTHILTETFIKSLHQKMYGDVWKWAGAFRKTNKNIGIAWHEIPVSLRQLLQDTIYWIDTQTFGPDEIAIRFKHRLVSIHCFPNGNGRHSRLMADIVIDKIFNQPVFSWGSANWTNQSEVRVYYIKALKNADQGDYEMLLKFARS